MYTGYMLRMLHLKKRHFSVHCHHLLPGARALIPECHLAIARVGLMVIAARPTMN